MFYTEGSQQLKEARLNIAKYSIPRAQKRLHEEQKRVTDITDYESEDRQLEDKLNSVANYDIKESQYADERCVSRGVFSPDQSMFGTSGWSGDCKVWTVPNCDKKTTLKGHTDRAISIRFHP